MKRDLLVGGACLNQIPMDWANNTQNILEAVARAREEGVELLCLPELCLSGYGCEDMFLSKWLPEKALDKLLQILPELTDITVAVGLPFAKGNRLYNTVAVVQDGVLTGFYAKHHLANDGVHYEPRWFDSWPFGIVEEVTINGEAIPFGAYQFDLEGINVAFEICEDAWKDDRPASYYSQKPDIILNPSASHFAFGKGQFREQLVTNSSERFDCTYLYTNLLGNEAGRMIYDGDILVARSGELIGRNTRLSFQNWNLLTLKIDAGRQSSSNIRPDWEDRLEETSHVIPLALFDYLRKSHSKGFVLSLSGGADSSSIAVFVSLMVKWGLKELGHEGLQDKLKLSLPTDEKSICAQLLKTAYQGTQNSSDSTFDSAKMLAQDLGASFFHWTIDEEVTSYTSKIETAIGRELTWEKDDITLQNIQARARSPIIWMMANLDRYLLLSTSNRSEGDVGYATMDGDTSGSISPIAAIDKAFVLKWLRYAEKELGIEGLAGVNSLQPTAELRPLSTKQTDEEDLMPYEVLVKIEELGIRERKSPTEVFESMKGDYASEDLKNWIRKFFRLWSINQWKRERIAPSFHLDDFNVDPRTWCRFPILSGGFKEELEALSSTQN